jgi:uncharacterized membrane protein YebE (DUF533 family)
MKTKLMVALLFIMGMSVASVNAQTRSRTQKARIAQGVKSGELTRPEARNLVKDQREIRRDVKAARADGVVTRGERKEIRQDKNQASRKIYRKKHNNRDRN